MDTLGFKATDTRMVTRTTSYNPSCVEIIDAKFNSSQNFEPLLCDVVPDVDSFTAIIRCSANLWIFSVTQD